MNFDLVVSGDLVFPDYVLKNGSVAVKDGKIAAIGRLDNPVADTRIDATGNFIFPGIVDAHVHCYSNPDEGFDRATSAAAAGGVTTIIEMPYDKPVPVNSDKRFLEKVDAVKSLARVDVALMATIAKEGTIDFLDSIYKAGVCGIKLSLFETDPVRFPRIEDEVLWEILPRIAKSGIPVGFHAENDRIIKSLIAGSQKDDRTSPIDHCLTRPPITETLSVLKLLELAHWTGFKLHLHHVSHIRAIDLAVYYRKQGVDVTIETCPHYLVMTEDDMLKQGAYCRTNPPMRSKKNMDELWQALLAGDIDVIGSDHAPWHGEQKKDPNIFKNASGAAGLETMLPLMFFEGVVKKGRDPCIIARTMAQNPARRYGLFPEKGILALGGSADLVILNPNEKWTFDAKKSHSISKWSPYHGRQIQGKVMTTMVRGKIVYSNDQLRCDPGFGRFVPACWGESCNKSRNIIE